MYYLYLISSGEYLKFGIAKDVRNRMSSYRTHNPCFKIERIWAGYPKEIRNEEQQMHKKLNALRDTRTDWVKLKVEKLKKELFKLDGRFKKVDTNIYKQKNISKKTALFQNYSTVDYLYDASSKTSFSEQLNELKAIIKTEFLR